MGTIRVTACAASGGPARVMARLQPGAAIATVSPVDLDRGRSIVRSDHADRPVLLEGGQLHLLDVLETVLSEGCLGVAEIDALAGEFSLAATSRLGRSSSA